VADCASVAGLAALAHFRRPDVTLQGDVIQVALFEVLHTRKHFNKIKGSVFHFIFSSYSISKVGVISNIE
jgi:hypothetical protein